MAQNNQAPDRDAAERALIELLGAGEGRREALADDALRSPRARPTRAARPPSRTASATAANVPEESLAVGG